MISVARNGLRVVVMVAGLAIAALAAPDEVAEVEASGGDIEDATPLICNPEEIDGSVVRLSLDTTGAMRARGAVWSNVAPCNVSVYAELRRNGTRIDSQQKSCGDESCKSRLLSAGNPAGDQTFCLDVRQASTGTLLARQCKVR